MAEMKKVIDKIKIAPDLTPDNLKPEDYTVPGGDADQVAIEIAKKVKTAQLRKFFNRIKDLHQQARRGRSMDEIRIEILKLIPELVYAKGRKVITDEFYQLMETCLLKDTAGKKECRISSFPEFDNFMSFLEAIVAYHKKAGG